MKNTEYGDSKINKHEIQQIYRMAYRGELEVSPDDWDRFLETFGNQHAGWLVNVFTCPGGKKCEKSTQVIGRPLEHITVDWKAPRPEVQISVAGYDKEVDIHRVPEPKRLVLKQDSAGAHEGLDIFSADGTVTSIRFRVPARPETVDGILAMRQGCEPMWAVGNMPPAGT
jgi:hypothetical protein